MRNKPTGGLHEEICLEANEEWELYHNSFSLCSKKVRVCLAEAGLPYRAHHINLIETGSYETCSPAFLEINPAGTVPVLVHNGHPIYESHEQIRYMALRGGAAAARLFPEKTELRELVSQWTDRASLVGDPIANIAGYAGNCATGLTLPLFAAMVQYIPNREILKGL
ncbi:MAG: glutathione S-transferase N-terminal domain-containing protein, partial [Pseudomonadota bacterium]